MTTVVSPPDTAGRRHGPRVKRGDVRVAILTLLTERPLNGYQMIQEITERSQGLWKPSPGSVYPALQQLEDEELIQPEEVGGRRKYHLTSAGRRHVEDNGDTLVAPWVAVAESVTEEMVDVRDLLTQVNMALQQVVRAGSVEQMASAAAVLTNTRRALYRILADDTPAEARTPAIPPVPQRETTGERPRERREDTE